MDESKINKLEEMILSVLADHPKGLTPKGIQEEIEKKFKVKVPLDNSEEWNN